MKWVALIAGALALCWLWRNRRRVRRFFRGAAPALGGQGSGVDASTRAKDTVSPAPVGTTAAMVRQGSGPDALPGCAMSETSICGR